MWYSLSACLLQHCTSLQSVVQTSNTLHCVVQLIQMLNIFRAYHNSITFIPWRLCHQHARLHCLQHHLPTTTKRRLQTSYIKSCSHKGSKKGVISWAPFTQMDLRDVWPNCTKFGKDIGQLSQLNKFVVDFRYMLLYFQPMATKMWLGSKIEAKLQTFLPL